MYALKFNAIWKWFDLFSISIVIHMFSHVFDDVQYAGIVMTGERKVKASAFWPVCWNWKREIKQFSIDGKHFWKHFWCFPSFSGTSSGHEMIATCVKLTGPLLQDLYTIVITQWLLDDYRAMYTSIQFYWSNDWIHNLQLLSFLAIHYGAIASSPTAKLYAVQRSSFKGRGFLVKKTFGR